MELLAAVFGKTLDIVWKPVGQELGYLFCYKSKVEELNQNAEKLQRERETVQHKVDEAERNGKRINPPVKDWLQKVDEIVPKNEELQKDGGDTKTKCSNGLFPNLIVRHRLGRRAAKLAEDVDKLRKDSQFDEVSHRPPPTWVDAVFSEIGYESLESRNETLEEIMKALKDSSVRTIGIYGQGGVGKTTLVNGVAKKALEMKLFNVVVQATVARNPQIKNIQGQISDMLGMLLEEETETGRAGQLRERLKKDKENTLVILDDLWDGLDLNKLGIPVHDDSSQKNESGFPGNKSDESVFAGNKSNESGFPGNESEKEISSDNYGGCKILLTSRSKEVLSTQMDVKENSIFSVGVLEEKEAEMLFKKVAEVLPDKNSEFDSLASKIAKKCAGLPVALVTVGRALKNKSSFVWNDALRQLEMQEFTGVQGAMEFSTKLSYDHLENKELKATFLLCAQMGNDSLILDLLKYCIGLGILEGVYTIRESRDKLNVLIGRLRDSSLLLGSYSSDRFTMHDIVHDAALSIAFKEQHAFIKRYAKLDNWLDKEKLEKYTAISLHYCDIVDELPESINCPRLKVFHIGNKDHSLRIPDKFFEGMTELKVLVLTGIDLSCMPSSIKCLKNLRMLCLEQCVIGDNLSMIAELKKLRILSLSGSELKSFPAELGRLGKLQLLDVSNCSKLGVIMPNVISCLNNLEELYMRNNLVQWEAEGKTNASLAELSHLHQLTALDIQIPDLDVFPSNLFFDELDYYMITIGDFKMFSMEGFKMPDPYEASRTLALQLKEGNNIHSEMWIKLLFKTVENLFLGEMNGVENIFYELNLQGFPCLKHLSIANNFDIKYIINTANWLLPQEVFTNLESLHLYKLENMEKICCSHLTDASFGKLKIVKIKMCHQLQNLFSFSMVRLLTNLETIEVSECDSLKEIVDKKRPGDTENQLTDDKVEFTRLRHVTLQCLSQFTGFYTNGMMLQLFSKRVDIPKLESLELIKINISNIWSDLHPSSNSNFQFLIKLDVKNCSHLKYLLSFSMAGCLVNLKSLHVSKCEEMEELLIPEDSINKPEVDIFPNLKEIKLSKMKNLTEIWHKLDNKVGLHSQCNLESVSIEKCEKLVTVFPPHLAGRLKSLESLVVNDSELVEVIFDLGNIPLTDGEKDICLRNVKISFLRSLKHVWNKDPKGILNFKSLQDVQVYSCRNLKNLFPFSVASGLQQLESLDIGYCTGMEEIVGSGNGSNAESVTFKFPQLTSVALKELTQLRSLYSRIHNTEWPQLKNFEMSNCPKLAAFTAETTNPERLPILSVQVIPNLQSLRIQSKEANSLFHCIDNHHMKSLKILQLDELKNLEFPYGFLRRTPNLEVLRLNRCDFQELLPHGNITALQKIGTVVQLKDLSLTYMPFLHNIGFERDPALFRRLERLSISGCHRLINLAPGSIYFTHLTYLQVDRCEGLINLMESSTAKTLSQLTILKVRECRVMEEIVAKEESGDERESEIVFCRLTTLELESLQNLTSFCSSKNCSFMFPSLEKMVVRKCPKMKIFSVGVTNTPKLRKVHFVEGEEEGKWYWEDNLNGTIQKVFTDVISFRYFEDLKLSDYPQLEQLWHGEVPLPDNCFQNLKNLVVENCEFLSTVIPCNLLPYLKNLEELRVQSCNSVEKVFDISDIKMTKTGGFHLKKMTLEKLPNLKNICFGYSEYLKLSDGPQLEQWWYGEFCLRENCFRNLKSLVVVSCDFLSTLIPCNLVPCLKNLEELRVSSCSSVEKIFDISDKMMTSETMGLAFPLKKLNLNNLPNLKNVWNLVKNSQGPFRFPNLQNVRVSSCEGLNFLFPAFLAEKLVKLENLHINNCEVMEEIVGKDEAAAEGAIFKFKFPCLTTLTLDGLFKLKCFYPGRHNLECPMLNSFKVFHCGKLEIFTQEMQSYEEATREDHVGSSVDGQPLQEFFPKLETLSLNPVMLRQRQFQGLLNKIKSLTLQWFHNVNEEDVLLYGFLKRAPNLEILQVSDGGLKVIIPSQRLEVDCTTLPQLRELRLTSLPCLKSIGLEHTWLRPLCDNLQVLEVEGCDCLITLVQSAVSFCNLKQLSIWSCPGLEYLFTSSIAKSLVQLEEMSINYSKSTKEIVAKEEDESSLDEIIFEKLKTLSLRKLSSLLSFYTGNNNLNFPSLETVIIDECPRMKFFSQGVINAPMLGAIQVSPWEDTSYWDGDLNSTVLMLLNEKLSFERCFHLKLSDYPELEKVWEGQVPLPKTCFGNLYTLVVENCDFLSNVIPSYLLPNLKNLRNLRVKNCIQAEVIFDINDMNMETIVAVPFSLKYLTLDQLPNLKHVWSKDPEGIVSRKNLEEVQVTKCKRLKTLFTTSFSKNHGKLEKLTIKSCEAMEEIVGRDEAAVEGVTTELVFPFLTSLVLSEIPELKFFYPGRHNLVCTKLRHLRVYHCGKLEMFTLESQIYQEGHSEDHQGGVSIDAQPLFSIQKVIPKLEELSLNEKEAMMLWHGESQKNLLRNVKCLQLYCFHNVNEADILPFGFLLKVPNIETLAIACSDFKEIFPSQRLEDDHIEKVAQLRGLRLENLSKLTFIGLENSWLDRLCENLKILEIWRCPCLTKIVQSVVSFSRLEKLLINECLGLEYLFTSSTAKSLVSLQHMSIEECESIKEIVAKEGDESIQEEIIFRQLKKISLNTLSSLASFYTGNFALKLPSLKKVIIAQCPKMKIFSQGVINAPILITVRASLDEYDSHWEGDLNSTIEKLFQEKVHSN